jgi:hypothetical protein
MCFARYVYSQRRRVGSIYPAELRNHIAPDNDENGVAKAAASRAHAWTFHRRPASVPHQEQFDFDTLKRCG